MMPAKMTPKPTKEQVRELWIERLESGVVRQTQNWLGCTDGSRCCLGVLCDVAVEVGCIDPPEEGRAATTEGVLEYAGLIKYLPDKVIQLAGLKGPLGDGEFCESLGGMNDRGVPFAEIAKVIRNGKGIYFAVLLLGLMGAGIVRAQAPGVLTRSYDNARSGWNPNEAVLTQASVGQRGLVRVMTIPVTVPNPAAKP
jgi:hypothetical protein